MFKVLNQFFHSSAVIKKCTEITKAIVPVLILIGVPVSVQAQAVTDAEVQQAVNLYRQQKYAQAAQSFEKIIQRQQTAGYCYYAALANQANHQDIRAQQLFQYIVTNFPATQEAAYAKQALAQTNRSASNQASNNANDLPEKVKAMLPPNMQELLKTPAGRQALQEALKRHPNEMATIRKGEAAGLLNNGELASSVGSLAASSPLNKATSKAPAVVKEHPFSPEDIRRDGAAAIDQMYYPNCWFEASMAALAELPRGQKLISDMIRCRQADQYIVRFPGDGVEYIITPDDLRRAGIHDSALWASLIEGAQIRKFPENAGANGRDGDMSRLEIGLGCITGRKAEVLTDIDKLSSQELSSFIGGAVKSQNPVVCSTFASFKTVPLAITRHAYTITGFDPSRNMIRLRNPWGKNQTERFYLPDDPNHINFKQMDNGVFEMSIPTFQKYFWSVVRSFI